MAQVVVNSELEKGLVWHKGHVDEDVMTGHVFGTLRYVPEARQTFLLHLAQLNGLPPDALEDDGPLVWEPWPSWEVPDGLGRVFSRLQHSRPPSRRHAAGAAKGGIVPDVVLTGSTWRLIVEAELSKPYDAPQLVQQYLIVHPHATPGTRPSQTFQVLVGPTIARPRQLDEDVRTVWERYHELTRSGGSPDDLLRRLLWIGWGDIEGIFRQTAARVAVNEAHILLDAAALLRVQGYQDVEPPVGIVEEVSGAASPLHELVETFDRFDGVPRHVLEQVLGARDAVERLGKLRPAV